MRKKIIFVFVTFLSIISLTSIASASGIRDLRNETRFMTDKMAHELRLSTSQYNDVFEINYDFLYSVRNLLSPMARGSHRASEKYYSALEERNSDLSYVLDNRQYVRFMGISYFFRPVAFANRVWTFPIYIHYRNRTHFYYRRPSFYLSYSGRHARRHYRNSYYRNRYRHRRYTGTVRVRPHVVVRSRPNVSRHHSNSVRRAVRRDIRKTNNSIRRDINRTNREIKRDIKRTQKQIKHNIRKTRREIKNNVRDSRHHSRHESRHESRHSHSRRSTRSV